MSFNFAEPLLYLTAMGVGLGAYVQPMEGLPYLNYLAPGLIASSAMFATMYECTYGTFIRMEYQKTFQAMLATPLSIDDVIMGEILYGAFKSALYGTVILLVIWLLGLVASPWALLVPFILIAAGFVFALMSLLWTGLVPNIDNFNYYFSLVMTPLFLFSGVFFPLSGLPEMVREIVMYSPLYYVVHLTRSLVLGQVQWSLLLDFVKLLAGIAILFPFSLFLMRRLVIK
jgi:lipooligosaccharide transport system permease protein